MSYRCEVCNAKVPHNTPLKKVPVFRSVSDPETKDKNTPIGSIKKEYAACPECANHVEKGLEVEGLRYHYRRLPIHPSKRQLLVPNPPNPNRSKFKIGRIITKFTSESDSVTDEIKTGTGGKLRKIRPARELVDYDRLTETPPVKRSSLAGIPKPKVVEDSKQTEKPKSPNAGKQRNRSRPKKKE